MIVTMRIPAALRPSPLVIVLSLACPVHALAQDGGDEDLQAVRITAARAQGFMPNTVEAGSFRGADVLDVPATVNVITREVLELQAAAGLYDALRNTAGVTRQQNGGDTWDQLVIRGIAVENRTNYRLNGALPVMNFGQVSMENKERVEVLKGATALYYGFTSPAGVVNFVTKRAGRVPVDTVGLTLDDNGSAVATLDVARRFGPDGDVGVRINAAGGTLGSHLDGVGNGNRGFASGAFDWRVNARLRLRADLDYDKRRVTEQAGINLPPVVGGVITLPRPVDPRRLVGPDWTRFETHSRNALLRADVALSDAWALTLEAGHAQTKRDRALPIFRFNNAAAVATGAGRITGNLQHADVDSGMLRAELAGQLRTGVLTHEVTFGASSTDKRQAPVYQSNYTINAQNLYDPLPVTNFTVGATPSTPTTAALDSRDEGVYLVDRITLGKWQVIGGVRRVDYRSTQGNDRYDVSETTPLAAVIYRVRDDVSVYASVSEGLEEGEAAPAGSANEGTRMAPGVSKQKEVGARWRLPAGVLAQMALFDIERPGYYTNSTNVFTADGQQRYRGVELSVQGRVLRNLSWQASGQVLDPEFRDINAAYDGKLPENAARRTASSFVAWDPDAVPGLTLTAGAYYTGRRPVNDLNQAWLGGSTLLTVGARYAGRLAGKDTTWQLNVDNATDKQYWAGAGTRLSAGLPRLVKVSMKVAL